MRLTPQVLTDAPIIVNPEKKVVLLLRDLKIPYVENLGITRDSYEVIDFNGNELVELSNFPRLKKLHTLLVGRNSITYIDLESFAKCVPNLNTLVLVQNNISRFREMCSLSCISKLENLSLMRNPIASDPYYRLFVIWLIPSLKIFDFSKIKQKERDRAKELFGESMDKASSLAKDLLGESYAAGSNTFTNGGVVESTVQRLSTEERSALLEKLEKTLDLEEIEKIERTLRHTS